MGMTFDNSFRQSKICAAQPALRQTVRELFLQYEMGWQREMLSDPSFRKLIAETLQGTADTIRSVRSDAIQAEVAEKTKGLSLPDIDGPLDDLPDSELAEHASQSRELGEYTSAVENQTASALQYCITGMDAEAQQVLSAQAELIESYCNSGAGTDLPLSSEDMVPQEFAQPCEIFMQLDPARATPLVERIYAACEKHYEASAPIRQMFEKMVEMAGTHPAFNMLADDGERLAAIGDLKKAAIRAIFPGPGAYVAFHRMRLESESAMVQTVNNIMAELAGAAGVVVEQLSGEIEAGAEAFSSALERRYLERALAEAAAAFA